MTVKFGGDLMNCLKNLERINYPAELVMDLTKLYRFKGKDFYYEDVLKNYMAGIIKVTVHKDCFFAAKLLGLDISENRMRLILKKDSQPRTLDEKVLANLKDVFELIQKSHDDIELTSNEFLQLAIKIFKNVQNIGYSKEVKKVRINLLEERKQESKRDQFDKLMRMFIDSINYKNIEPTQVITNLYVDLLHMNVFTSHNEFMALIIQYCLLFRERFNLFKYVSFFEMYYKKLDEFKTATAGASYNWEEGFANTAILNRLTIQIMLDGYQVVEKYVADHIFDKKLRKIDNVETTILKLGEVFTKDQIKQAHPQLSDSTINRALASLKEQKKIRPNGTGRSATWVRLVPDELLNSNVKQMNLFDLISENDDL